MYWVKDKICYFLAIIYGKYKNKYANKIRGLAPFVI
jgi:hypothetical protein